MKKFAILFLIVLMGSSSVVLAQAKKKKKTTPAKKTTVAPKTMTNADSLAAGLIVAKPKPVEMDTIREDVMNGAYVREHTAQKAPVPLAYIREADAIYAWNIMRVIDLKQKQNLPLVHPSANVIDVLMAALKEGKLKGYIFSNENLTQKNISTSSNIVGGLEKIDTQIVTNPVTLLPETKVTKTEFNPNDVVKIRVKEEWVFDKQISSMQVRIVAIAPVQNLMSAGTIVGEVPMFWVYYPAIRPFLAGQQMFNWQNDGAKLSFDDFFIKRLFSSYVYKESNVKDFRIQDYATGKNTLLESERIKNKLTDFEQSLWEY